MRECLAKFLERVAVGSPGECWPWMGTRDSRGYGRGWAYHRSPTERRYERTHRISWEMHNEAVIPPRMEICHHCDNPPCVNPAHLFLGTHAENMADMARKGRPRRPGPRGVDHPAAKLTEDAVRALRRRSAEGVRQRDVAAEFGISQAQVWNIVHRLQWGHVA